jgi:hypothetical protein
MVIERTSNRDSHRACTTPTLIRSAAMPAISASPLPHLDHSLRLKPVNCFRFRVVMAVVGARRSRIMRKPMKPFRFSGAVDMERVVHLPLHLGADRGQPNAVDRTAQKLAEGPGEGSANRFGG